MSWLQTNPTYRAHLERRGLKSAEDFLALSGVILGGHPDRHVMTVEIEDLGPCFLKKEHRVRWKSRLGSWFAGCGWASKSAREAKVLQGLAAQDLGGPDWIAVGEADQRAFLLLTAVPEAVEVREYLATCGLDQAEVADWLGRALARFVVGGFYHPDLFSKHVLVQTTVQGPRLVLLDWQRGQGGRRLSVRAMQTMLAALDATIRPELVSDRTRLRCLRAFLSEMGHDPLFAAMARSIRRRSQALGGQRRIREMAQAPLALGLQNLVWLDGEALCVTRAFQTAMGLHPPPWLQPPSALNPGQTKIEQVPIPFGERQLHLVRRWAQSTPAREWWKPRSKFPAPEFAQAGALFRLERFRLPLPRLLAVGHRLLETNVRYSFLLTEPQANVVPLDQFLVAERSSSQRRLVLRKVGDLLRRLHEAGYGFSAGAIRWHGWAVQQLGQQEVDVVLTNVEELESRRTNEARLAARDVRRACQTLSHQPDALRLILGYWNLSGLRQEARPRRRAALAAARHGSGQPMRKGGRLLTGPIPPTSSRPGGSFWQRLVRGVQRWRQRGDWSGLAGADWPERIMTLPVTDHFHAKQGRSTGRLILEQDGRRLAVYLKRHYRLPWWLGWLATLWPRGNWSPAMQECANLDWATAQGLPVPKVVAVGEAIGPWGRLQSFLAIEELTDMLPLHEAIPLAARTLRPWAFRRWKAGLVRELARLVRRLHDQRVYHQDLYLCHFFVHQDDLQTPADWQGRVHLIDLHRFGRHAWNSFRYQIKDLGQFLFSSELPGVDERDRLRFWRQYLGQAQRGAGAALLAWWVRLKAARYRRHNAKQVPPEPTPSRRLSA